MTDPSEVKARVAGFATEEQAKEAGARLLEHGVGPILQFSTTESSVAQWWVTVLPNDYQRACRILGVEPVELEPTEDEVVPDDEFVLVKPKRWPPDRDQLGRLLALYLVLLVVITGLAFVVTVWLTGGFGEVDTPDSIPGVATTTAE